MFIPSSQDQMYADQEVAHVDSKINGVQGGSLQQAEMAVSMSKKIENDLAKLGGLIKQHEEDLKLLQSQRNKMECTILDLRVTLGKYHSSPKAMDPVCIKSEEETSESISKHDKSAAGVLYQLNTHHASYTSELPLIKNVLGTVATLGRVDDDNLSRLLSEYLGKDLMLAVVCKTYDGVKALEAYEKDGSIIKGSGLHGLGASIGRPLTDRFTVICLEKLRPYFGEFIPSEPQRRLDLLKPQLPNGNTPLGFIGFAVNMINVDTANLFGLTPNGLGLRETLFYSLFSSLQVYKTRAEMLQALPLISDGAISLDGGMLKTTGVFSLGDQADIGLKFPKSSGMVNLPVTYYETEKQIKAMELKKEKAQTDMKRLLVLLNNARTSFEVKKHEFLMFLAKGSSYIHQEQ